MCTVLVISFFIRYVATMKMKKAPTNCKLAVVSPEDLTGNLAIKSPTLTMAVFAFELKTH